MSDPTPPALSAFSRDWLAGLGFAPEDEGLWRAALTHGSAGEKHNYERLEFVGDRVLGLTISAWLYELSDSAEGQLAQRLNALVSGKSCAAIARAIGAGPHIILGKQARDDGGADSDNILGDVMESLLGASFIEHGFPFTQAWIREHWQEAIDGDAGRAKHPKSALQEWTAGNRRRMPEYRLVGRSGPDHAARFTVEVSVHNIGSAEATASSKHEAEAEAAKTFLEKYG